jgi:uncharacterized protein YndB with AHSA1/START domain
MTTDSTRTINLSIWVSKPPERVFQALTVPAELKRWLVPDINTVDNAPRRLLFVYPHHSFEIEFLQLTPDKNATLSWFNENGVGDRIEFHLEPVDGGTLVKFRHVGFDPAPEFQQIFTDHVEGWTMYLCNLRCYLDAGFDLRSDQPPGTIAM